MEVKSNVQKRRMERIRELQARIMPQEGQARRVKEERQTEHRARLIEEPPLVWKGPLDGERWDDPERAWKLREKEWLYSNESMDQNEREFGAYRPDGPYPDKEREDRFGGLVPSRRMIWAKLVLAAILYAMIWGVMHTDRPWAGEAKHYVTAALTQEMDYAAVEAWYKQTFEGAPSFLPAFGKRDETTKVSASPAKFQSPVTGRIVTGFNDSSSGILLATEVNAEVKAIDEGRIESAGVRDNTGYTVVIRHPGGYRSVYGFLQPGAWGTGDWVKAGERIGAAEQEGDRGKLYFALMKDQRYIDPAEVVAFD